MREVSHHTAVKLVTRASTIYGHLTKLRTSQILEKRVSR